MDTCLSIYKNHLPASGHGYSTELSALAAYYRGYDELMRYWKRIFPNRIYELDYEKTVGNPEREIGALLKNCGLNFEAACLASHKTKRVVSTLSAAQVRRPIYGDSVGSWKNYEPHLEVLRRGLSGEGIGVSNSVLPRD